MKSIAIVAVVLLTACGAAEATPTPAPIVTITKTAPTLTPPTQATAPIIHLVPIGGWPVQEAADIWNVQGVVTFSLERPTTEFIHTVYFEVMTDETSATHCEFDAWGCYDGFVVYLNTDAPDDYRLNIVTHELGHVLGLGHSAEGVMNERSGPSEVEPSEADLAVVYYSWQWAAND